MCLAGMYRELSALLWLLISFSILEWRHLKLVLYATQLESTIAFWLGD